MWNALSMQLAEVTGNDFTIKEKTAVSGGDINDCFCISDDTERLFVKTNDRENLPMFEAEAESLIRLAEAEAVEVPQVIHLGAVKDHAVLVLNYLPLKPLDEDSAYTLGVQLARLHEWGEQQEFGFDLDNYIGYTVQPNNWHRKWSKFFAEQRIGWQLQLASEKGIQFGDIENIIDNVKSILASHQPRPSLLHGDLWQGNTGLSPLGPVIFDPASYWGDRECDIAFTELFGRFPETFYKGYNAQYPLSEHYENRRDLYNLYHVLNHCNMFGGHYLTQAENMILRLELNT